MFSVLVLFTLAGPTAQDLPSLPSADAPVESPAAAAADAPPSEPPAPAPPPPAPPLAEAARSSTPPPPVATSLTGGEIVRRAAIEGALAALAAFPALPLMLGAAALVGAVGMVGGAATGWVFGGDGDDAALYTALGAVVGIGVALIIMNPLIVALGSALGALAARLGILVGQAASNGLEGYPGLEPEDLNGDTVTRSFLAGEGGNFLGIAGASASVAIPIILATFPFTFLACTFCLCYATSGSSRTVYLDGEGALALAAVIAMGALLVSVLMSLPAVSLALLPGAVVGHFLRVPFYVYYRTDLLAHPGKRIPWLERVPLLEHATPARAPAASENASEGTSP